MLSILDGCTLLQVPPVSWKEFHFLHTFPLLALKQTQTGVKDNFSAHHTALAWYALRRTMSHIPLVDLNMPNWSPPLSRGGVIPTAPIYSLSKTSLAHTWRPTFWISKVQQIRTRWATLCFRRHSNFLENTVKLRKGSPNLWFRGNLISRKIKFEFPSQMHFSISVLFV